MTEDRFKFRFWNKSRKIMETFNNSPLTLGGLLLGKNDNYKILSCTGLKDKNGKLIYEGDIVKMPFVEPILNYMPSDENTEFAKIEEFKGCFTIFYLDKSQRTYLYQWNNRIEVIGNIYENPELLEE